MKNIKGYWVILFTVLFVSACKKNPIVSFATDKTVYTAGQKVTLTNFTENGEDYVWTMPDGTTTNTENAEYIIDPALGFADLKFGLSAKAKNGCRHHSQNLTVNVIPQSWFVWSSSKYIAQTVSSDVNSSHYNVTASYAYPSQHNSFASDIKSVWVNFPNNTAPPAGTYLLQATNASLASNTAFMEFVNRPYEATPYFEVVSGQIHVEYIRGTLHIYFTSSDTGPFSGDLYLNP